MRGNSRNTISSWEFDIVYLYSKLPVSKIPKYNACNCSGFGVQQVWVAGKVMGRHKLNTEALIGVTIAWWKTTIKRNLGRKGITLLTVSYNISTQFYELLWTMHPLEGFRIHNALSATTKCPMCSHHSLYVLPTLWSNTRLFFLLVRYWRKSHLSHLIWRYRDLEVITC